MRKSVIVCMLLTLLSVNVFPQSMTLDEAIKITASELGQRINGGRISNINFSFTQYKIAVLNFSSDWVKLSSYVIDELNNAIVRNGSLTVVERQKLDVVRQEQKFQMTGEVSDESAQNIGKLVGAQLVLSGSFVVIGNTYRFRTRVISVETGVLEYSNSLDIKKDALLTALTPAPPKSQKTIKTWSASGTIFEGYTIYNALTIFGYTFSPDVPLGFSLGFYGIYTSLGFALPDWDKYKKTDDSLNNSKDYSYTIPDYNTYPYTVQRYEIIDWVLGYNFTIIPKILFLPVGVGIESVKGWRLQYLLYSSDGQRSSSQEWCPAPQWENNILFEAGLLLRATNKIEFGNRDTFSPYIYGSYRYIMPDKQSFSIGAGISFEKEYGY